MTCHGEKKGLRANGTKRSERSKGSKSNKKIRTHVVASSHHFNLSEKKYILPYVFQFRMH